MVVKLDSHELFQGAVAGVMRQAQNIVHGARPRYGASNANAWTLGIEGCLGEMAVAKALNRFWSGKIGTRTPGDIGPIEVRTRSRHTYDLIVHSADPDDVPIILVTGMQGEYVIRGWIRGADAKRKAWWSDPAGGRPAYFVPQQALHPFQSLPAVCMN